MAAGFAGTITLTTAQADDLDAGRYYVNVHNAAHPGGEVRRPLRLRRSPHGQPAAAHPGAG